VARESRLERLERVTPPAGDVTSYAKYAALAERLRAVVLAEDGTPGAPLCRWRRAEMIVDTDASVLGFSDRWYPAAIETAQVHAIAGHAVRIVTAPLFIATKLEAFHGRGANDVDASHDLEAVVTLVRVTMLSDVGVRDLVRSRLSRTLRSPS
jgi:hypothetical protein